MAITITREPDFEDIDFTFRKNRRTRDVASLYGIDAVINSIENLVNTNFYEKPFRPSIGSNVRKLLFENINDLTSTFLATAVREVIVNHEPRCLLRNVIVTPEAEINRYTVTIIFNVNNVSETVQVDLFLTRVR
jgi:phage baseplate assembly protein W